MFNGSPFPVDAFPQIIRNAIYEVEQHTQPPLPLAFAEMKNSFCGVHTLSDPLFKVITSFSVS